ncbi:RluA family pseudouridine synthase [Rubritalea spongiae]|uniref:Pseudouridine synthase n=1 Tax=Rubritalea spongiae TaxID=430797 RepID=A0ABW5E2Z8_9BACT
MKITVDDNTGKRIDAFLTTQLPDLSRGRIQSLLKSGDILVNGAQQKAKYSVQAGDIITIEIPEPEPEEAQPEDIPLSVIYEDDDLIVINKDSGLVVHPAAGNQTGTLVNALLFHCKGKLADEGGAERPGIVHRLDKDTSGCMVVAKTNLAHVALVNQFKERETKKQYLAVVEGKPNKDEDSIYTNIGRHPVNRLKMAVVNPGSGKPAITDYQNLGHDEATNSSLIHCDLHTGRTHQIRVHMLHLGCPIIGDPIYAKIARQKAQPGRLMLHARRLSFNHPRTSERMTFRANIPAEFENWTSQFPLSESD